MDEQLRKIDEEALRRQTLKQQAASGSFDVIISATPGSMKRLRVVQAPAVLDYDLTVKVTKEIHNFYDIVKRFGEARSQRKHMRAIRE